MHFFETKNILYSNFLHTAIHTCTTQSLHTDAYICLSLLSKLSEGPEYSIWWRLSDRNHMLMKDCEVMIKLILHASLLKDDDVRLKGSPIASRFCDLCDHAAMDDARHLIMQCPELPDQRTIMFRELAESNGGLGDEILQAAPDISGYP